MQVPKPTGYVTVAKHPFLNKKKPAFFYVSALV